MFTDTLKRPGLEYLPPIRKAEIPGAVLLRRRRLREIRSSYINI